MALFEQILVKMCVYYIDIKYFILTFKCKSVISILKEALKSHVNHYKDIKYINIFTLKYKLLSRIQDV